MLLTPFQKFLQETLSWTQFEGLEKTLDCSAHRVTKLMRNPKMGTLNELLAISVLLKSRNSEYDPHYLYKKFGLSKDNVTPEDFKNIIKS